MNRNLKNTLRTIVVFIGLIIILINFLLPEANNDKTQQIVVCVIGTVFSLGSLLIIELIFNRMEDKTEKKKKVSETDKYLSKRLSTEDFMKKIKHLLHDKKSVNLLIWPMITVPSVFTPLVCFQRWGLKSTSSEGGFLTMTMNDFFQSAVDKGKENMLPTLLFAYIGNDSVVCDIPALLRKLKAELPGVEIFIFCSKIYSQEKANAIYNLIEDTIVKKYTVSDSIFHDHERMKNCISGIQSFLEE